MSAIDNASLRELRARRLRMEEQIHNAIISAVEEFRAHTGLTPSSIQTDLVRIESIGDRYPRYACHRVRASVDL